MNLVLPEPPATSVNALTRTINDLAARGQFGERKMRRARPEQLSLTAPHQVFTIGLDQLRERPTLEAATSTGWRYLIEVNEDVVAAAETNGRAANEQEFSHINHGPFVEGTVRALSIAEQTANDNDAEARLLQIPAIYFAGIWLIPKGGDSGEKQYIVPISPTPPGIDADRAYEANQLMAELKTLSETIPLPEQDDARGG